ncbi:lactate utilization protein [Fusibacter sp. 3D3]|uniref:lactate utilization protein n=1 Tax=Fusibacter sp. 3D3 TaxID=1048380 RepID=UPI0008536F59|nr:lactate utilization protein [Fusibacter sp. 3D3]GAU78127.1 transcriptional regulators of sugar metabolism [Fusibacter sp. 3D3]
MDQNTNKIMSLKINRTLKNLEKNQMKAHYIESISELKPLIKSLLSPGDIVAVGGSQTLFETDLFEILRSGEYEFLDRYAPNLTPEAIRQVHRSAFSANAYLMSTNALTENGELYNVDGSGNRVAALTYGPDRVIVIAGINKLVRNLDDAVHRNRQIAAPANCTRLNCNTPCVVTGECQDCMSPGRICCHYVTTSYQRVKDRIQVILVGEPIGY